MWAGLGRREQMLNRSEEHSVRLTPKGKTNCVLAGVSREETFSQLTWKKQLLLRNYLLLQLSSLRKDQHHIQVA